MIFCFLKEKAFVFCVSLRGKHVFFKKENREVSPYFLQDKLRCSACLTTAFLFLSKLSFHCFLGPLGRWALTLRISCWRRGLHCNAEQMRAGYVPSSHSAATAATYNYKGQEQETLQQRGSMTCEPQLISHCTYSIRRCPIISYSIVICSPVTHSHLHYVPGCQRLLLVTSIDCARAAICMDHSRLSSARPIPCLGLTPQGLTPLPGTETSYRDRHLTHRGGYHS